jgi:hypothetical protein
MGDWRADTVVSVTWPTGGTSAVYAWVLPADVAGSWALTVAGASRDRVFRVRFDQRFQELTGTASGGGRSLELGATRLWGDSLAFHLTDRHEGRPSVLRFTGRVFGGEMRGIVQADMTSPGTVWRARRP